MFAEIVLGHLAGDYLLQNKSMALKKSEKGWAGLGWCTLHCLIYTACICLFLWTVNPFHVAFSPLLVLLVFLTHWPLDRWSLGSKWLKLIRGRDFIKAFESKDKYREIDVSFSCLVYAVVDNSLHLILLWFVVSWLI
jgi:hypothetical protein